MIILSILVLESSLLVLLISMHHGFHWWQQLQPISDALDSGVPPCCFSAGNCELSNLNFQKSFWKFKLSRIFETWDAEGAC